MKRRNMSFADNGVYEPFDPMGSLSAENESSLICARFARKRPLWIDFQHYFKRSSTEEQRYLIREDEHRSRWDVVATTQPRNFWSIAHTITDLKFVSNSTQQVRFGFYSGREPKNIIIREVYAADGPSYFPFICQDIPLALPIKSFSVEPATAKAERDALVTLFEDSGGTEWLTSTNWCSDKPVGEWQGVGVDDEGRVVSLHLHENNLVGKLTFSCTCKYP